MTIKEISIIADRIKDLRTRAGLTQRELANDLGVSQNAISRMEDKGGGTIQFLLDLLAYFESKYDMSCFLQSDFKVEKTKEVSYRPLDSVATERLVMLKEKIDSEIESIISLFPGN